MITEHEVRSVRYAVHVKRTEPDAPKSLRVAYEVGLDQWQREWICVEHAGYARQRAEAWWRQRSELPCPVTAVEAEAIALGGGLREPTHVTVRASDDEPFARIISYRMPSCPRRSACDESDSVVPTSPRGDVDEPPF